MKEIKFSRNELRVIEACMQMTGGNEINEHITTHPKLTETQSYDIYRSCMAKIVKALSSVNTPSHI